jgi:hypothetical protein
MELHSTSKMGIPLDLCLDAREDSGVSDSTIFDDCNILIRPMFA